jgi:predicted lipid-binding transport protein (Tim44 family)
MVIRRYLVLVVLVLTLSAVALPAEVWARAGSGGSRGSRSYSAPVRPAPTSPASPTSPSRSVQPAPVAPRPSPFGGFMGGLGGFLVGGLLGSLLFGGLGHGAGGIGLLDVLLIGLAIFMLVRMFARRRQAQEPAYASAYGDGGASTAPMEMPAGISELERGVGHIRQLDAAFEPRTVEALAREGFSRVQAALTARDLSPVADRLTARMFTDLQAQVDRLRTARQTDRVEQVDVRRAEVTEAWQEGGQDFTTVYLAGSLVDYTVDDPSGAVIEGSKTAVQEFEEFWTFTRPAGPNAWKLSAIQSA